MRFYKIVNADSWLQILRYKAIVFFKFKGKVFCKIRPLDKTVKTDSGEIYESDYIKTPVIRGYIVCKNEHILYECYFATSFLDGLKTVLNIPKKKPKNILKW